ncbi:hypothetical protein DOM21_13660 [Bacteriovorax stolpii]|uniref:hypothetical protein n=1 Tax=Bacteriovorax stolpii TaxID=960 RepID=UPI001156EB1D|nr:hypothetical protein [Bacteriovorax stolpii]QDK42474.1 hypothetical protein DOM21_13660 [Bacteriovorax stolpii]
MKNALVLLALLTSFKAFSWEAPEILENACYEGCTEKMETMYSTFLNTPTAPKFIPGMYSGECNHLSPSLDPDTTHYIGMLLNTDAKGAYMSPVLQFFGDKNDMADWSLEDAKREMSPDWIEAGRITWHSTSATAHVEDAEGYPALVYWARQNVETKEIYFLAWLRGFSYAFCTLKPNVNGLP